MRVLVLTGAGVSAESGIPTFRGKDGYWRNLDPTKLATPEAFARDPSLVWDWYRERRQRIREAQPNPAHKAIVKLAAQAGEFLLVTQNVDNLHARAGMPKDKMVQIHGDIFVTRCSRCDWRAELCDAEIASSVEDSPWRAVTELAGTRPSIEHEHEHEHDDGDLPKCPLCSALMRPGVVWFGEQLDLAKIGTV